MPGYTHTQHAQPITFGYWLLSAADALARDHRRLSGALADAIRFAEEVAADPANERFCRMAAGKLYHATTAALLASEGTRIGKDGGDARRLLLSRFVLEHRLAADHAAASLQAQRWENEAIDLLLGDAPVSMQQAAALVQG